jgi:hypothetical protein
MDTKNFDQLMSVLKFLIVTVGFGYVTLSVNTSIQTREIEIKELDQVGKYVQLAVTENVGARRQFAEYFATVTRSEELKRLWKDYAKKVNEEFEAQQRKELAKEETANQLKQQIGSASTTSEKVEKEKELARTLSELNTIKRELSVKPIYAQQSVQAQAPGAGWVYLGEYDKSTKTWKTVYYDIGKNQSPNDLLGKKLTVTTVASNVRETMPSAFGSFGDVIDNLKNGTEVTVNRVQEWHTSGYQWAAVSY